MSTTTPPTAPPAAPHGAPERVLVVGATGITGTAVAEQATGAGHHVLGLSRRPSPVPGVEHVRADLTDAGALRDALAGTRPDRVVVSAWIRQDTEEENVAVNAAVVRDVLAAATADGTVRHVALLTGLKHYLGPFEAYGQGDVPETPFREETPRLDAPNFYYAQEDELFAAAARHGFGWSVHRAHTVSGFATGGAMNLAATLAAAAAICRETHRPLVFPGSEQQWNGLTDITDAGLLAEQVDWAATTPAARDEAFNTANGDVFRWRWMWPRLAEALGVAWEGFDGAPRPFEEQMRGTEDVWRRIAEREGLVEPDLAGVASWWHTDGDLGREIECLTDVSKSRRLGFTGYRESLTSLTDVFERYARERIVPAPR